MAIISDGSTDIELEFVDEKILPSIDKTDSVSSGGSLKQQVGGERFKLKCKARVSSALFRTTLNLLKNGSEQYFYTTEVDHPIYSDIIQPIAVNVSNIGQDWDNRKNHYIKFDIEGTDYI